MGLRGLFEGWHIVILLLVVVVLFGAKRLPDASRSVGRSLKIFKAEIKDLNGSDDDEDEKPSLKAGSVRSETHTEPAEIVRPETVRPETVETRPVTTPSGSSPADRSPVDHPRV